MFLLYFGNNVNGHGSDTARMRKQESFDFFFFFFGKTWAVSSKLDAGNDVQIETLSLEIKNIPLFIHLQNDICCKMDRDCLLFHVIKLTEGLEAR